VRRALNCGHGRRRGRPDRRGLKIYCVDSFDAQSWFNLEIALAERTYQHRRCEEWILNDVMPWIYKLRWHRGGGDLRVQPSGTLG